MLNAEASRAAKRTGMQMSIMFDGEWTAAVLIELRAWLAARRQAGHETMTFEQFRHDATAHPTSHKAWGSLPALACREGLIAPMTHPDGSPVMRRAESLRTHAHPVRVWKLASSFSAPTTDAQNPTVIETEPAQARRQPLGVCQVGEVRHSHLAGAA